MDVKTECKEVGEDCVSCKITHLTDYTMIQKPKEEPEDPDVDPGP